DEPGQRVAGSAVAVAAEVDTGEHDLHVALSNAPTGLAEHRSGGAAPGRAANRRDHAEGAREAAPVLDLHERAHAVEPRVGLHATDGADVAGDEAGRVLAAPGDDHDVLGKAVEAVGSQARTAAGHVHAPMAA